MEVTAEKNKQLVQFFIGRAAVFTTKTFWETTTLTTNQEAEVKLICCTGNTQTNEQTLFCDWEPE